LCAADLGRGQCRCERERIHRKQFYRSFLNER
jgi:hypothetical protein